MIQNFFAQGTYSKALVCSLTLLKGLERAGHITLHADTGMTVSWYGQTTKAWYIAGYKTTRFKHRNGEYVVEYRSGSFCPYVYRLNPLQ
jgi:hypothetical protein